MLGCFKPLASIQSSEKVDSDNFYQFFHSAYERDFFGGSYFIVLTDVIQCITFSKVGTEAAAAAFPNQ